MDERTKSPKGAVREKIAHMEEDVSNLLQKIFELIVTSGSSVDPTKFIGELEEATAQLPGQFMTVNNLERFLAVTTSSASIISDLSRDKKLRDDFLKIISTSQYLADILVRHPSYFRYLFSPQGIESRLDPDSLLQELSLQASIYKDVTKKNDYVRRIYKREILRIGGRDICGHDGIEETTLQISQLAETILKVFFEITASELSEWIPSGGEEKRLPPLSCIALGKFGGNELNYSSDIDFFFLFSERESENPEAISEYANHFVSQLIKHLTMESAEGHLYRVDLRLRPDGSSGAAAQSLDGALAYYESRGELWERQMLIKARHVAGDESLSRTFLDNVRPFIYPRTWLENPIDEIPRMKIRIEATDPSELNIKLRRGGIRDIEFIVQALQLLNGGSCPEIQTGNTLQAIKTLERNKFIDRHEAALMTDAYKFFRLVEHRLQLLKNLQTHTLPSDSVEFRNLSKRCGYKNERKFRNELFSWFDSVAGLFNNVFRIDQPIERTEIEQLLDGSINDERTRHVLENYGLTKIEEAYRNTRLLSRGVTRPGDVEFPATITKAFREIAPDLFEDIKHTVDQDLTLKNLARLVPATKSLEVFYKSLEDESFRRVILTLCSKATRFVDYLTADALLLDMTLSADRLFDNDVYVSSMLPPSTQKEFNEIKLGLLFLLGEISISEMQVRWTKATEYFFLKAVEEVFPKNQPVVVAGGKFGSGEMSFMSDLDVIFILPEKLKAQKPAIEKKIPEIQKRLLDSNGNQFLTMDTKLRPEGKSAPLSMTESEYEGYLEKRASVWEMMAMTRFRVISSSPQIQSLISQTLSRFKLNRSSVSEIALIYNKVIQSKKYFDEVDVKSSDGGIVAIEFIVQTLTLANLEKLADKLPCTILELTEKLKGLGALTDDEANQISETYDFYRTIEFGNYTSLGKSTHKIPHDERELASLALHLDFKNPDEFLDSLKSRMRRTGSFFRKVVSSLAEKED
jgi:glutamate-ammonia-ligase adenylyltransferase